MLGYSWLSIGDTCSVQKPFTTAHVWLCMNSCFCLVAFEGPSIVYVFVILGQTRKVDVIEKLTYWQKPSTRIDRIKIQKNRKPLKSQSIFNSINASLILLGKCATKKLKVAYSQKVRKKYSKSLSWTWNSNFPPIPVNTYSNFKLRRVLWSFYFAI